MHRLVNIVVLKINFVILILYNLKCLSIYVSKDTKVKHDNFRERGIIDLPSHHEGVVFL